MCSGYYTRMVNRLATDTHRHTQTIKPFCLGDPFDFARDRLAQAKPSCLSGRSGDTFAKRWLFLAPQVAEPKGLWPSVCVERP